MKKIIVCLVSFVFVIQFYRCKNYSVNEWNGIDTVKYLIDTSYKEVSFDNHFYTIFVLRNKFDKKHNLISNKLELPASLLFINEQKHQQLLQLPKEYFENYTQTFASINKWNNKHLSDTGEVFFNIIVYHGGSSSKRINYLIKKKGEQIILLKVYEVEDELTYVLENNKGKTVLLMQSIWDMRSNEAHFSNHKLQLSQINFTKDSFIIGKPIITKNKYPVIDNDTLAQKNLKAIISKESLKQLDNFITQ